MLRVAVWLVALSGWLAHVRGWLVGWLLFVDGSSECLACSFACLEAVRGFLAGWLLRASRCCA
jgi:hypothetical protein